MLTQTAALRGDFAEARRLLEEIPADASATVEAFVLGCEQRWDEALPLLSKVHRSHLTMYAINFLPTLIEAAARTGKPEEAAEASDYLAAYAEATGEDWVRAVSLRSRALLEEDADTEGLFTEALDLHGGRGDSPLDHGLTHLAYGEWLRRVRRGNDAKEQIALALDRFDRIGAETAAQRARAELRAAGGRAPAVRRKSTAAQNLTPQEFQVAKLAATGLTNREIGSQLYLSPRTVGYHLYKAYPKLGVKTRTELAHLELG
ncbi:LuxR C-terminal-related transcriptional regulator [Salininema proteolyticum]|uniref:helix-turn-helix transcriptional regulator n=1 Tax=Salininema proteolyticum TaxID=1607685 RepID=UPI00362E532F